ncbi:MAG: hypothetical protein ACM3Q1_19120 [Bacteroidales bacterium]|jgi:hypothetical protein
MAPDRGSAGVYDRPNRRPLWIAAAIAVVVAGVAALALWWLL